MSQKNNYFENSSHKTQQPIISTPTKIEKSEYFDEHGLNSCNKADLFSCYQDLPHGNHNQFTSKNNLSTSPDIMRMQQNYRNFKTNKEAQSPVFTPNPNFNKYYPNSSQIGYNKNIQQQFCGEEFTKEEYYNEFNNLNVHSKNEITQVNKQYLSPNKLLNGNQRINHQTKIHNKPQQTMNEPSNKYYLFQSPVYHFHINKKNQFQKFVDSDCNKEEIEEFALQNYENMSLNSKIQNQEQEIRYYKRGQHFNNGNYEDNVSENDGESAGQNRNRPNSIFNYEQNTNQRGFSNLQQKNSTKRSEMRNKLPNQFDETSFQGTYDQNSQSMLNPYKSGFKDQINNDDTTAKKTIDPHTFASCLTPQAKRKPIDQKRILFESSQQRDERNLDTPSTKKKSNSVIGSQASQFNNPSTKKKEDKIEQKRHQKQQNLNSIKSSEFNLESSQKNKEYNDKISKQVVENLNRQENVDEENYREDKSQSSSENSQNIPLSVQNSTIKPFPTEEKKICCNCKRTKCLKLYCECFAASKLCEGCSCQGCFNKAEFEAKIKEARYTILERNTSAFTPKIDTQDKNQYLNEDGAESEQKHSKGCNCKKSNCKKKYCECYQLGVKCTKLCKCDNCKNRANFQDEDPYYRINGLPQMQNGFSYRMNHGRNGVNFSESEYSQYNQYNYNCKDRHAPQYYKYPFVGYPYLNDYYLYHPDEQNENSNRVPVNMQHLHFGHPDKFGYDLYSHPHMMHPSMHMENMRGLMKVPRQYSEQLHQYNIQNEYYVNPIHHQGKKMLKNNHFNDDEKFENLSYYYEPHPEKRKKMIMMEDGPYIQKVNENDKNNDFNTIPRDNYDESIYQRNKDITDQVEQKLQVSPRFKEDSKNDLYQTTQQFKRDELQQKQKEQKMQKSKGDNEGHSIKQKDNEETK